MMIPGDGCASEKRGGGGGGCLGMQTEREAREVAMMGRK